MAKGIFRIILTRTLGFIFFLILLAGAEYLTRFIQAAVYHSIVNFLIDNIFLSFLIFLLTLATEILWSFDFPLNVPAPISGAISGLLILEYFYRMWFLIENITGTSVSFPKGTISLVVFWVIILLGYVRILFVKREVVTPLDREKRVREVAWKEIGAEFKQGLYNIGRAFNRRFEPKVERKKRRTKK